MLTLSGCELLALLLRNLSVILQVALVAHKDYLDLGVSVFANLGQPALEALEALPTRNVVD